MLHNRTYQITDVPDAAALATKLTEFTWTLCTGFRLGGFLWLNDSTSEDGAQEYAVIREVDKQQVESITASWCDHAELVGFATQLAAGELETRMGQVAVCIDRFSHRCQFCA